MSHDKERLYRLLPAIYRLRDAKRGEPLKAYLSVIAEQVAVLEENLDQLYDDLFVETSAEWVLPYIGDLIGYRTLHGKATRDGKPTRAGSRRAEVANTIAYRRRKGTASMLEQLARDVTGWDARAVEYFELLATTQYMNHTRPHSVYSPDLRRWEPLERVDTPFDRLAHTANVRSISRRQGKHNIPNIGIFLWRLDDYPLTDSPAVKAVPGDDRRFLFSPLGNNVQLFTFPTPEGAEITHIAEPINVPDPISRGVLHHYLDDYYGEKGPDDDIEPSLHVKVGDGANAIVDSSKIVVCDLSDAGGGAWAHHPDDKIAIDPELGRLTFPTSEAAPPDGKVYVTFRYAFSADMGGGEYERADTFVGGSAPVSVQAPGPIQDELDNNQDGGTVEVQDSGRYEEQLSIALNAGTAAQPKRLELRAANEKRPTVVLSTVQGGVEQVRELVITGGDHTEVTLNGLLIVGGGIFVPALTLSGPNKLKKLRLRHCTLVPGLSLGNDGRPNHPPSPYTVAIGPVTQPPGPSLVVALPDVEVEIEHCIVGALRVVGGPDSSVTIVNSIVDATSQTRVAYGGLDGMPGATLEKVENVTIVGKVRTRELRLVSNTIFAARAAGAADPSPVPVYSERKQAGCVRYSYVPVGSRTPRRYRCQPDLATHEAISAAVKRNPQLDAARRARIARGIEARVRPDFSNRRYGRPAYAQLRTTCPVEITRGADDESEMGAFHDNYQPQRETDLRTRLDEYLRFGLEAGIFYASQKLSRKRSP